MIYKGSNKIDDISIGNQTIDEVYHGSDLVYKKNKLKIVAAGMSFVPGHTTSSHVSGFIDGSGTQQAIRCLTLIRSDGAAKTIPFSYWNDSVNIAPTDEQIANATGVEGSFDNTYNSGVYLPNASYGVAKVWNPAIAVDPSWGVAWSVASQSNIRSIRNETLSQWNWRNKTYSNQMTSDYTVTVENGVCKMYKNDTLIKTISNAR